MAFKTVPMAKVALVGPKTQLAETIGTLHDLNLLHIQDYAPGDEGFDLGSPLPGGAKVSERLLRVRGVLKGARIEPGTSATRFTPQNLRELETKLSEVEDEISHLVERRNALLDDASRLDEEAKVLQRIPNFPLPVELTQGYGSLATATGFVPGGTDLAPLRAVHKDAEVLTSDEPEGLFVFVAAPKDAERRLQDALGQVGFAPVDLPETKGPPADRVANIKQDQERLRARAAEIESKVAALRERYGPALLALDEYLSIEADKATAPVRFRTTRNSFMIEGWIPRAELKRLRFKVDAATAGKVFLTELETPLTTPWKFTGTHGAHEPHHEEAGAGHHDEEETPPTEVTNGRLSSPYLLLTDTYSRAKYTEVDPTLFFLVGFPFFYGFMLGDIAYGIILLLFVYGGVFTKVLDFLGFESKRAINRILAHSAFASILFGLLYTEFFGMELFGHHGIISHYETHIGPIPFPLARFENVKLLLFITLVIAAVHMFIGLFVGLRNAAVSHGWSDAIKHRGSWILILLAATLAGAAILPPLLGLGVIVDGTVASAFNWTAAGLLVLGAVLVVMGEGATALMELPTILSNLLSYTRLVAIGLSSAGIALAGNRVGLLVLGDGGIGGWIAMAVVLLFFHGLNLVLGVIGPALHSLRLHYVEFFTKFYEGGGEPYRPFGATREYTSKEVNQA